MTKEEKAELAHLIFWLWEYLSDQVYTIHGTNVWATEVYADSYERWNVIKREFCY